MKQRPRWKCLLPACCVLLALWAVPVQAQPRPCAELALYLERLDPKHLSHYAVSSLLELAPPDCRRAVEARQVPEVIAPLRAWAAGSFEPGWLTPSENGPRSDPTTGTASASTQFGLMALCVLHPSWALAELRRGLEPAAGPDVNAACLVGLSELDTPEATATVDRFLQERAVEPGYDQPQVSHVLLKALGSHPPRKLRDRLGPVLRKASEKRVQNLRELHSQLCRTAPAPQGELLKACQGISPERWK